MEPITINTTVNADIKKVWEYYTNPKHIVNWNFVSDEWHCPTAENDLRPGGRLRSRMEAKDGSSGFDFEAVYDEVEEYKTIKYTMGDARQAATNFENAGGITNVSITFDPENENTADMQKGGWQAILDNFKKYTESN